MLDKSEVRERRPAERGDPGPREERVSGSREPPLCPAGSAKDVGRAAARVGHTEVAAQERSGVWEQSLSVELEGDRETGGGDWGAAAGSGVWLERAGDPGAFSAWETPVPCHAPM